MIVIILGMQIHFGYLDDWLVSDQKAEFWRAYSLAKSVESSNNYVNMVSFDHWRCSFPGATTSKHHPGHMSDCMAHVTWDEMSYGSYIAD